MSALLQVRDLTAGYGKASVLSGITLVVGRHSAVTIIGANGAGKTTTLNAIMGLLPARGEILFDGAPVGALPPEERLERGLCLVPEQRELFASMSVRDNLLLGGFVRRGRGDTKNALEAIFARFPRLRERSRQLAGTLSGGERQMLAVGRALMSSPKLLMLDEPSLGLAPKVVQDVLQVLRDLRGAGVSILLVEQNARAALRVSDHAYVMEMGRMVMQGPSAELQADHRIAATYLGTAAVRNRAAAAACRVTSVA